MLSLEEVSNKEEKDYKQNMLQQRLLISIVVMLVSYILFSQPVKNFVNKYNKFKLDTNIILSIIMGIIIVIII